MDYGWSSKAKTKTKSKQKQKQTKKNNGTSTYTWKGSITQLNDNLVKEEIKTDIKGFLYFSEK